MLLPGRQGGELHVVSATGFVVLLVSAVFALTQLTSVASARAAAKGKTTVVTVTAGKPSENVFRVSPTSVKHGTLIFKITNLGKRRHSFQIHGHATKPLGPHQSTTLTVVLAKPARYFYSDVCLANPNQPETQVTAPCPGGILRVT